MSGCVFFGSCTSKYTPFQKASPFASGKRLTLKTSLEPTLRKLLRGISRNMPAPCVAYAGSLSFARLTLKTSVYHALLLPLFDRGHEATHNHTSPFGRGNVTPPTLPPLMVRGGVEQSETEGIRKSVFDKVNRNADINPQKGRHLLCTFCPCEKRKQGETSGNAARDKPAVSRTAARRRFLSCIIFPQNHRYIFSAKKCNETPYNPSVMLCMTAPFAQGSHGWGGLRCRPLHKGAAVGRRTWAFVP